MPYTLSVTATAARALSERLPPSVAAAVLEFLNGDLLRAPRRVGHELQRELAGTWAARRGVYRILYEIHDEQDLNAPGGADPGPIGGGVTLVVDVAHRGQVYRRR